MVCAFKVGVVELLVEVLLFLVLEFYFLTYTEPDGVGFSSSILLCMSLILRLMYLGRRWLFRHILLNHIAAFVFSNLNLVFLQML